MKIILKIAWRNIWRNPARSLVVIGSIMLGIWAAVFVSGFSFGLNIQRMESTIKSNLSHIQIHSAEWEREQKLEHWIGEPEEVERFLSEAPEVEAYASRIRVNGMIASAYYTSGIQITGIDPPAEAELTGLLEKVDSGSYFDGEMRNPVLIGKRLAEKLRVKPGSKLVLTFTDEDGNIVSGAFKVTGIFSAVSSQQEKGFVYVKSEDILQLLGSGQRKHEYALLLKDQEQLERFAGQLEEHFPQLFIQTWKDLSPELALSDEMMSYTLYIIVGIIMLALCFGIVNTMLMAVLERRKELGMLMSVGMNKSRIFSMIVLETTLLSLCGGPLGIILGFVSIELTQKTGLDLSFYGEGLASYGIETVIYPAIETGFYFGTAVLVMGVTVIAALWPARRALKLNPVEAIRTI